MSLKIIGCLLLIASSFSAGVLLAKRLHRRRDFLLHFQAFLHVLRTQMRYQGSDIFSLADACAGQTHFILKPEKNTDQSFEKCWGEAIDRIPRIYALSADDLTLLRACGAQLGKTDLEGQLNHLDLMESRLKQLILDAEENIEKKTRLYKTMGFFVGASAAILLL